MKFLFNKTDSNLVKSRRHFNLTQNFSTVFIFEQIFMFIFSYKVHFLEEHPVAASPVRTSVIVVNPVYNFKSHPHIAYFKPSEKNHHFFQKFRSIAGK